MNRNFPDLFTQENAGVLITVGSVLITALIVIPALWLESKIRNRKDKH